MTIDSRVKSSIGLDSLGQVLPWKSFKAATPGQAVCAWPWHCAMASAGRLGKGPGAEPGAGPLVSLGLVRLVGFEDHLSGFTKKHQTLVWASKSEVVASELGWAGGCPWCFPLEAC